MAQEIVRGLLVEDGAVAERAGKVERPRPGRREVDRHLIPAGVDDSLPIPYSKVSVARRRGPVRRLPPLPQQQYGLFKDRERVACVAAERIAVPFRLTASETEHRALL
ncbi:MAG: hypothetical protein K0R44_3537 [Thermomicrobiales bacterium]|nr:hypothetical protein [Thermomicrobiales bacterium]